MKQAILQMADHGPVRSFAEVLRCAGYETVLPNDDLRDTLRSIGCDTVLYPRNLTRASGYDALDLPEVGPEAMDTCDLYLDVKHYNCPKVWERWPRLRSRSAWARINGARGEITERGGDEVNLQCPLLTHNVTYRGNSNWNGLAYPHWPPFVNFNDYGPRTHHSQWETPVCLIHNVNAWGYGELVDPIRNMGVRCYGSHGSPDKLLKHSEIPGLLASALCMVHLKSSDAPGYSLYEALSSACPVVITKDLILRCDMQDLYEPGVTCLTFENDSPGAFPNNLQSCVREIREAIKQLTDPAENRRIGEAGRARLQEVMWSADRPSDVASFREFMQRHFPD